MGTFRITVPTVAGLHYILESADSLVAPQWRAVDEVVGDGTVKALTDPVAPTAERFYRVRVQ